MKTSYLIVALGIGMLAAMAMVVAWSTANRRPAALDEKPYGSHAMASTASPPPTWQTQSDLEVEGEKKAISAIQFSQWVAAVCVQSMLVILIGAPIAVVIVCGVFQLADKIL